MIRILLFIADDPDVQFIVYGKNYLDIRNQAKKFVDAYKNRDKKKRVFAKFPENVRIGRLD